MTKPPEDHESGLEVCVRTLRTQQRAKSQCMKHNLVNARSCLFGMVGEVIFAMEMLMVGVWRPFGAVARPSTESLILAQDERWRRA